MCGTSTFPNIDLFVFIHCVKQEEYIIFAMLKQFARQNMWLSVDKTIMC